jgi:hypothetical protein
MSRKPSKQLGVYCLEGRWAEALLERDRTSVRGLLDYLSSAGLIKFEHHRTRNPKTLKRWMAAWQLGYPTYELGYFAGHGNFGGQLDPRVKFGKMVYLDDLADSLRDRCQGRVVFFATCVTARNKFQMTYFLKATGATAVCGYRKSVDRTEAFAADVLIIDSFARNRGANGIRPKQAFREIAKRYPWIVNRLGFVYFMPEFDADSPESESWVQVPPDSPGEASTEGA